MGPAARLTTRQTVLLFCLPALAALAFSLLHAAWLPLGDDWLLIESFDRLAFFDALLVKTGLSDGLRFRPMTRGHVWIEQNLFGLGFATSKAIGLVYLGLTGSALGLLLSHWRLPFRLVLSGALLFVFQPSLAELHGWASTRVDLMASFFGLFALWLCVKRRLLLSCICFFAAFAAKESSWPLLCLCPALAWVDRRTGREVLLQTLPAVIALICFLIWKWLQVGALLPKLAAHDAIPLWVRIKGYIAVLDPMLVNPLSSAAQGGLLPLFSWTWLLSLLALCFIPLMQIRSQRFGSSSVTDRDWRYLCRLAPVLVIGFVLTLALTFGVPPQANLSGARLWFLPSAFFVALLLLASRPSFLVVPGIAALFLLHANLAPYREANQRMEVVLERLAIEVPARQNAIRIRGLEQVHGPVPLFILMNVAYMERFTSTVPEDRPLLTLEGTAPEIEAALDKRWREFMLHEKRKILDLVWDKQGGRLIER